MNLSHSRQAGGQQKKETTTTTTTNAERSPEQQNTTTKQPHKFMKHKSGGKKNTKLKVHQAQWRRR